MRYIAHRRLKSTAICGAVNLPALTECESVNGFICWGEKVLCAETSENAHQYFARNDDGRGMERGRLTQAIMKTLGKRYTMEQEDPKYQARWDKVWDDPRCQKYKRTDHADFWLWNHEFYNAPIEDLQHIASLVGAKEG